MMTIKEGHFRAFKELMSDSRTNLNLQEKVKQNSHKIVCGDPCLFVFLFRRMANTVQCSLLYTATDWKCWIHS